jgi:hypothetical protein
MLRVTAWDTFSNKKGMKIVKTGGERETPKFLLI